jgi:hypothetical protein
MLNNHHYSIVGLRVAQNCLVYSGLQVMPDCLLHTLAKTSGYAECLLIDLILGYAKQPLVFCFCLWVTRNSSCFPVGLCPPALSLFSMPSGYAKEHSLLAHSAARLHKPAFAPLSCRPPIYTKQSTQCFNLLMLKNCSNTTIVVNSHSNSQV